MPVRGLTDDRRFRAASQRFRDKRALLWPGFRKPHVAWRIPKRVLDSYPPIEDIPLPDQRAYPAHVQRLRFISLSTTSCSFSDVRECDGNPDKATGATLADWAVSSHCSGSENTSTTRVCDMATAVLAGCRA